jgi:hypothetical protein
MSSNEASRPKDVTNDAHMASPAHLAPSNQKGGGALIFLFFMLGMALSLVIGWVLLPKALYSQKNQPFDFSHQIHMEQVDNGCESCHFFREDGTFSGSPRLAQCVDCHSEMMGESENEAVFVEQYVAKGQEVPWLIYSRQPDCVFFSHAAHIQGAKLDCVTCHGNIGTSDTLKPYQYNRMTGYSRDIWGQNISGIKHNTWDRMKMDDCAACHKTAGIHDSSVQTGRDACFVCHK